MGRIKDARLHLGREGYATIEMRIPQGPYARSQALLNKVVCRIKKTAQVPPIRGHIHIASNQPPEKGHNQRREQAGHERIHETPGPAPADEHQREEIEQDEDEAWHGWIALKIE